MYLFLLFFVLLLPLILLLLLLLLNDQFANFFGAFTLFQGKELCFFLCGNFDTPLFCCVIHELRPKERGRIKKSLPHKTKQSSLPRNKARNGKKSAFFCQFSSSASFSSVYFVYLFLLFFCSATTTYTTTTFTTTKQSNYKFFGGFHFISR